MNKTATIPSLRDMIEAGVHFGHKKQFSDARGQDNFFGVREKVVIINLEKTKAGLTTALEFIAEQAAAGATFLFVSTKPSIRDLVQEAAEAAEMPYVTNRWLGGTLTNFTTIAKSIKELSDMEKQLAENPDAVATTKKERLMMERDLKRSKHNLSGLMQLKKLPDVVIIVDPHEEDGAVMEANRMNLPIVALLDTNANPKLITHPIPANDDTPKSVGLILGLIKETIKTNFKPKAVAAPVAEAPKTELPAPEVKK